MYYYFQITDEYGNPIPLSIQETRQLLSQGHFISQLNDNQIIRVHPGMFAQQLQTLNIHVDEDTIDESGITMRPNMTKNETISAIQADAAAIVQALEVISSINNNRVNIVQLHLL